MSPAVGITLVLLALSGLVALVKALQSRGITSDELSRKLVQLGMGIVCLPFPWLFSSVWPVWILAGLALAGLAVLRWISALRRPLGSVLHNVERSSLGEFYFPLGVATVFSLAEGQWLLFCIPVALLTFADAAGALIGRRWGRHRFPTLEGTKSVEGSAAVGLVSAACVALPLAWSGYPWLNVVLIAAVMGLFGLLLEAIAWRGLDNVFLPLAAFAQLSIYLELPWPPVAARLAVITALLTVAVVWRPGLVMDHGARFGAALAVFFFWAVGGWPWVVAPVLLVVSYLALMPSIPGGLPRHNLLAVLCLGSAALPWAVAHAFAPEGRWLLPYTVGLATQQAIIATIRYQQARPARPRAHCVFMGTLQAWLVQFGVGAWLLWRDGTTVTEGAAAMAAVLGGVLLFSVVERELREADDLHLRWWKQASAALVASLAAAAVVTF